MWDRQSERGITVTTVVINGELSRRLLCDSCSVTQEISIRTGNWNEILSPLQLLNCSNMLSPQLATKNLWSVNWIKGIELSGSEVSGFFSMESSFQPQLSFSKERCASHQVSYLGAVLCKTPHASSCLLQKPSPKARLCCLKRDNLAVILPAQCLDTRATPES